MKIKNILYLLLSGCILSACSNTQTTQPERKDIVDAVFASGNVFYMDEYLITSNTEGYLEHTFKREAEVVKMNEALFSISNLVQSSQQDIAALNYQDALSKSSAKSSVLAQKKSQVIFAMEQLKKDSIDFARNQRLFESKSVSKVDLEKSEIKYLSSKSNLEVLRKSYAETEENLNLNSKNAKKQLDIQKENTEYNTLYSIIDGVVAEIYKQNGDLVRKGEVLAKVVGGAPKLKLFIAEEDVKEVKAGQEVIVSLNIDPTKKQKAHITKLYPIFNAHEQSFIAEADFDAIPADTYLFTQTQLQANIIIGEKKDALIIPASYLIGADRVQIKGESKLQEVSVGIHNPNWVEIVGGLSENQTLVLPKAK